jgi:hypothetical protein
MKRKLPILLVLFIIASITASSQKSVIYCGEVTRSATKLAKKIKKKHIKNANANYPQALMEIEKVKLEYPKEDFGYDKLAKEIPSWIRMYKALEKLDGNKVVDKKGNTFEFVIVDYKPLLVESKTKAGEAHFNAGKELMSNEDFDEVEKGFDHFRKAKIYVDTYNTEIDEMMAEAYYTKGSELLNSSSMFSEKVKSVSYFNKALKIKKPYKDVDVLCAELYYEEGVRLTTEGETLAELSNGIKYLRKSLRYKEGYKDAEEKIKEALDAGAEIAYQEAVELSAEESFEGQAKAAKAFKAVDKWVVGYKDAAEKAIIAEAKSYANVMIIGADGKAIDGSPVMAMNNKCKKGIHVNRSFEVLKDIDLNDESNYPKATELSKKRFIYVKFGDNEDGYYSEEGPKETVQEVAEYTSKVKGEEEKSISKKEYEDGKKINELTGNVSGYTFREYKGKIKSTTEYVSYTKKYIIQVVDARIPDSPFEIGTITITKMFSDKRVTQTYTGAAQAKPSSLKKDTHQLLTEKQFIEKANKEDTSIGALLNTRNSSRYMEIVKILNKNVEYVSFE